MSEMPAITTPRHLWIVGIVALLWNLLGAMDYVMTETKNEAYMDQVTPEQLEFFTTTVSPGAPISLAAPALFLAPSSSWLHLPWSSTRAAWPERACWPSRGKFHRYGAPGRYVFIVADEPRIGPNRVFGASECQQTRIRKTRSPGCRRICLWERSGGTATGL